MTLMLHAGAAAIDYDGLRALPTPEGLVQRAICDYCGNPIPEGRHGPYCSDEHEWLDTKRHRQTRLDEYRGPSEFPRPIPGLWGKSPRNRSTTAPPFKRGPFKSRLALPE